MRLHGSVAVCMTGDGSCGWKLPHGNAAAARGTQRRGIVMVHVAALLAVLLVGCGQAVSGTPRSREQRRASANRPAQPAVSAPVVAADGVREPAERQPSVSSEASEASPEGPPQPWRREALLRWLRARHPEHVEAWQRPPSRLCEAVRVALQRELDASIDKLVLESHMGGRTDRNSNRRDLGDLARLWVRNGQCEAGARSWARADAGRAHGQQPSGTGPVRRLVMDGTQTCVLTAPDTLSCWGYSEHYPGRFGLGYPVEQMTLCLGCKPVAMTAGIMAHGGRGGFRPGVAPKLLRLQWGGDCARQPVVVNDTVGVIDCQGRLRSFYVATHYMKAHGASLGRLVGAGREPGQVFLGSSVMYLAIPQTEPPHHLLQAEPVGSSCLLGRDQEGTWLSLPAISELVGCDLAGRGCRSWTYAAEGRPVPAPDLVTVRGSVAHVCGLDAEGRVWCRGEGLAGQVGYCALRAPWVQVPLRGRAVALDVAPLWSCAALEGGRLACWGDQGSRPEVRLVMYKTACERQLVQRARRAHRDRNIEGCSDLGLSVRQRTVLCGRASQPAGEPAGCGGAPRDDSPWLAPDEQLRRFVEQQPRAPRWSYRLDGEPAEVAMGFDFVCTRLRSGAVRCFSRRDRRRHAVPLPGRAVELAASSSAACAVLEDRSVWCWLVDRARERAGASNLRPMRIAGVQAVALAEAAP